MGTSTQQTTQVVFRIGWNYQIFISIDMGDECMIPDLFASEKINRIEVCSKCEKYL